MSEFNLKEGQPSMTVDDLKMTHEYLMCSPKMRRFIEVLLTTKDKAEAAKMAYGCKSKRQVVVMASMCLKYPKVRAALGRYYQGSDSKSMFLTDLRKIIGEGNPTPELVRLLELYVKVEGFGVGLQEKLTMQLMKKRARLKKQARVARIMARRVPPELRAKKPELYDLSEYEKGKNPLREELQPSSASGK